MMLCNKASIISKQIKSFLLIISLSLTITSGLISCNNNSQNFGKIEQKNHHLQGRLLQKPLIKNNVELFDSKGNIFSLEQDTRNHLTLIALGYTSCPDICPLHMSVLAGAYSNLPIDMQRKTKVIFISTDPERDNKKITNWAQSFNKDFIGLTGTPENLIKFQNELNIPPAVLEKNEDNNSNYAVSHATWITVFTDDNIAHFIYPIGITQREWVQDLKLLNNNEWKIKK
jgi:protein SCO1/2